MGDSETFALRITSAGYFAKIDGLDRYIGGVSTSKWGLDPDKFGYFDLVDECEKLGYVSWGSLWFRNDLTQEYKIIADDKGVMEMIASGLTSGIIHVYIEGGKTIDDFVDEFSAELDNGVVSNSVGGSNAADNGENQVDDNGENQEDDDYNSSEDSDFTNEEDEESDVSLGDLDYISDDEYVQAKLNLKDAKCSVFDLVDKSDDVPDFDTSGPYISDYEESDGDVQSSETDEEGDGIRHRKERIIYDPKCDHKSMEIVLGMHFQDGIECRKALKAWAIEHNRFIRFRKVSKTRLTAKCTPPCPWMVYASEVKANGTFIIKTLVDRHRCSKTMSNKLLSSKWIAEKYLNVFRVRYNLKISDLREDIKVRFKSFVPKDRLYKAKTIAQNKVRGTVEEHYALVRRYIAELRRVDREGRFELLMREDHVFKGLYIGFSALRKGFLASCRPFVGLDGAFLKSYLGGCLLCAVGKDGNNQMYPVAWAVVEAENEDCWTWFLKCLLADLDIKDGHGWTFMSDQQKGLENAVRKIAPNVEHRNCARHVYMNWLKKHKGQTLKNLFWAAAWSTYAAQFKDAVQALRRENEDAFQDFMARDTNKFCKPFISTISCSDMVENNISECFNGYIVNARGKHIIHMLEDIRKALMVRQVAKFEMLSQVTDRLCPNIRKKLEELREKSIYCSTYLSMRDRFEVHVGADRFVVDCIARSCACRVWDLTGIPCEHAIAAIQYTERDPADFVHEYYTVSKVIHGYQFGLEPINGERMWPDVDGYIVKPPLGRKRPGRPKNKRRKAPEEKQPGNLSRHGIVMTCSNCQQEGHNKKGCKNRTLVKPPSVARKRGRPTKPKENGKTQNTSNDKGKQVEPVGGKRSYSATIARERAIARKGTGIYIRENSRNVYLHQAHSSRGIVQFNRPQRTGNASSSSHIPQSNVTQVSTKGSSNGQVNQPK